LRCVALRCVALSCYRCFCFNSQLQSRWHVSSGTENIGHSFLRIGNSVLATDIPQKSELNNNRRWRFNTFLMTLPKLVCTWAYILCVCVYMCVRESAWVCVSAPMSDTCDYKFIQREGLVRMLRINWEKPLSWWQYVLSFKPINPSLC